MCVCVWLVLKLIFNFWALSDVKTTRPRILEIPIIINSIENIFNSIY